jgi:hypothetical protein
MESDLGFVAGESKHGAEAAEDLGPNYIQDRNSRRFVYWLVPRLVSENIEIH